MLVAHGNRSATAGAVTNASPSWNLFAPARRLGAV